MSPFRSEMLPFHPPRYAPRIGEGLSRYGRARALREHGPSPRAATARERGGSANAAHPSADGSTDAGVAMAA